MFNEREINKYFEDDTNTVPEYILKMSQEEMEAEAERLFKEMKEHPQKREKVRLPFKTILDK